MSFFERIFNIRSTQEFNALSLELFHYQFENNALYHTFCSHLNKTPTNVSSIQDIPFLPISFFKTHDVKVGSFTPNITFLSSGTTGSTQSKHHVKDLSIYEASFIRGFEREYGNIKDYCILGLLPSYLEREGSSLIYMVNQFIKMSNHKKSGFFLENELKLVENLQFLTKNEQKTLLIGVSFALLNLAENFTMDLSNVIVMETGGMKGRRQELTREEIHQTYKKQLNLTEVHSEYGMTELLSQAYSKKEGIFTTPPWMKILIRDVNDPLNYLMPGKTGGINVIDLANIHSCSFIATQDLGKNHPDNSFEVLGRFDNSDLRGCNLLITT